MKSDDELGMGASITRRDFVQGVGAAALGLSLSPMASALSEASNVLPADYPPTKTGLRGSHPGSFEAAHDIAREGQSFPAPEHFNERYDLVIVGAGISGLAAAHYYEKRFGADARILLLENHDDFGGHARRNEFHQGGQMRLSLGGVHNLEWWKFNPTVKAFLDRHGVDAKGMRENMQFAYGRTATHSAAMWFDEETYGVNRLVTDLALDVTGVADDDAIDQIPISEAGRASLKAFCNATESVFEGKSDEETEQYLRSISYPEFLRKHGGLTEDAVQLFDKLLHGGWGVEMRALSAMEVLEDGLPGRPLAGLPPTEGRWDYPAAMWPDGNASLARLQVAKLIPGVAPGTTADNVALATFDYRALDRPEARVRLRLNATVVNATDTDDGVKVSYVNGGEVRGDPDWQEGEAPHEIARQPFGNITITNADAAADAYTHAAIDQAYRAVQELPD